MKQKARISSIGKKMLLFFGAPILVTLIVSTIINFYQVRDAVFPLTQNLSQEILVARSAEIGRLIQGYEADVKTMSQSPLIRRGDPDEIRADLLVREDLIYADYEIVFFADQRGDFLTSIDVEGNVGDRDYFVAIMERGYDDFISNPMISRSTGEEIFVIASAVDNFEGERIGLMAATIRLETLSEIVGDINIGESGFGYVVDKTGLLIAHPDQELRMNLNLLGSQNWGYEGLAVIGAQMIAGKSGLSSYFRPDGTELITIFNPIPNSPGWSLGLALSQDELMGTALQLMRNSILLMAALLVIILLVVLFVSNRLAVPIVKLKQGVVSISAGDLEKKLTIKTNDEIQDLATAFNKMTTDLKQYIANLQETTRAKERIESELQVANKIQSSMLPQIFPPFPKIENLSLFAKMEAAREVGGDFYDFYLIDDKKFCFIIGDVAGKGIPAALFMVITRTILKNLAYQKLSPAEIFYQTNNMLCAENIESMFVSTFLGVLDHETGVLEYVNAGHNPPLIAKSNQDFSFLAVDRNLVLGGMEDYHYQSRKITIEPQDKLFLYTDGVTEAMNQQNQLFSVEKLVQTLNANKDLSVENIVKEVEFAVKKFADGAEPSDDMTMLAFALLADSKQK